MDASIGGTERSWPTAEAMLEFVGGNMSVSFCACVSSAIVQGEATSLETFRLFASSSSSGVLPCICRIRLNKLKIKMAAIYIRE